MARGASVPEPARRSDHAAAGGDATLPRMTVNRHFVTLDGRYGTRQVHYRRSGEGPVVLLLHQSPQSSREMEGLMGQWSRDFTLIAPDTPGYGQSDPLREAHPSIADLAAALGEFADALGLGRFGIYGFHTGASIGAWLAAAAPARVTAVAAHGLAQLTAAERADILAHYLPPLEPRWDGSHLAWLWSRIREQTIFFPWYRPSAATRMALDVPDAAKLQAGALELLRAGEHYATAYRAAFESQPDSILPNLRVPVLITTGGGDPLAAHLDRLRDLPDGVRAVHAASATDALARCHRHLREHPGESAPPPPPTRPLVGRSWSRMLQVNGADVHVRTRDGGSGRPLVLLHGAGRSSANLLALANDSPAGPVVIPDLPGHGESSPLAGNPLDTAAAAIDAVLAAQGVPADAGLVGRGAGAAIALDLARRRSAGLVALLDVPARTAEEQQAFNATGLPDLSPQWHGGHLLAAWHMLRDARLFMPWFDRRAAASLSGEPAVDPGSVQAELVELLKAVDNWRELERAAQAYPYAERLAAVRGLRLAAAPGGGRALTQRLAAATRLPFIALPPAESGWLARLREAP